MASAMLLAVVSCGDDHHQNGVPTPTPTPYSVAGPLNGPPSTMLAMLYGAGAAGLLLPARRRKRRK